MLSFGRARELFGWKAEILLTYQQRCLDCCSKVQDINYLGTISEKRDVSS